MAKSAAKGTTKTATGKVKVAPAKGTKPTRRVLIPPALPSRFSEDQIRRAVEEASKKAS